VTYQSTNAPLYFEMSLAILWPLIGRGVHWIARVLTQPTLDNQLWPYQKPSRFFCWGPIRFGQLCLCFNFEHCTCFQTPKD
jgi:hypothetical protein